MYWLGKVQVTFKAMFCLRHANFVISIPSISGSTDFGNVTHAVPGIHPYFYIGSEALNHTTEYTAASGESEEQRPLSGMFHTQHSVLPNAWYLSTLVLSCV